MIPPGTDIDTPVEPKVPGIVVIGASFGGVDALRVVLSPLPSGFLWPLAIVLHRGGETGPGLLEPILAQCCALPVRTIIDKAPLIPGHIHVAPGGYHVLIERNHSFSLSVDAKVCNVRPSVDVLFESAALTFGPATIGVVLTGANDDGARGLRAIRAAGGYGIVQAPHTAVAEIMPLAALELAGADGVLSLAEIPVMLQSLVGQTR